MRRFSFGAECLFFVISLQPAEAEGPSFDCGKARYPDEFAICRSPELSELDNIVAAGYSYLKARYGRAYADQVGIPFWRLRQSCQADGNCVLQRQVQAIRGYQAAGAPVSLPDWLISRETPSQPSASESPPAPTPPSAKTPSPMGPKEASSGTGFYLTKDGYLLSNAHVIEDCTEIRVETKPGSVLPARLLAKDAANDLVLLQTNTAPDAIAGLRFNPRLGEPVEAFGYPLTDIFATSGNFTLGNITALAGLADDSRYIQISVPVQPGNSGGPLLDQYGNVVGIVSSKLNALKIMLQTEGDIPQNVNFAIRASVAANFLQVNNIKIEPGEATKAMQPTEIAEEAKAMSVRVECR